MRTDAHCRNSGCDGPTGKPVFRTNHYSTQRYDSYTLRVFPYVVFEFWLHVIVLRGSLLAVFLALRLL